MRTAILTAVVLSIGSTFTPRSPAKELVEIRVHGRFYAAPATVPIVVAVEPAARNRALVIEADGDDYYRSSEIELDGEKEKRLHSIQFRSLPPGRYLLKAQVLSRSEVLGTAEAGVVVTGAAER